MHTAWQAPFSGMASNTRYAALADSTGAPATVGGSEEAFSAKHRARTRTIPDNKESCFHRTTLSSKSKHSAPLSRTPTASNAEDPEQ
jgi:hypothetical protein